MLVSGTVKSRVKDHEEDPIGIANRNPILDPMVYEVEFTNGGRVELGPNVITECMYTQCDVEGNQFHLMEAIVGHKMTDDAVQKEDMYFMLRGRQHKKHTTKGWMLCVQLKDKSMSWEKLCDMKESYPIEVAEYATALGIQDEPAFAWWDKAVLQKRQWIITAVNRHYHKMTHKFGIRVPKTVKEALDLDKENGIIFWWDAIMKEMKSVCIAFCILSKNEKPAVGSQFMQCHMIFDIKMEDFRQKARLIAGGHMTDAPKTLTYASIVSRETVRIALTIAAPNDLEVETAVVQNSFLTAPCSESIHTTLGPEFGEDQGKTAVIVHALYGLTSARVSFRNHLLLIASATWATIHALLTLTSGTNQWSTLKTTSSTILMSCYMLTIAVASVSMPSKNYTKSISSLR